MALAAHAESVTLPAPPRPIGPMNKIIYLGMFLGSWLGWKLGELFTEDMLALFFISTLMSAVGVWAGWWIAQRYR
jgi:hypothetical protein